MHSALQLTGDLLPRQESTVYECERDTVSQVFLHDYGSNVLDFHEVTRILTLREMFFQI